MDELSRDSIYGVGYAPFPHTHAPRWTLMEVSTLFISVAFVAFIYGGLGWFGWQQLQRLTRIENAIATLQQNDEKIANWINGQIKEKNAAAAQTSAPHAPQEKK